MVTAILVIAILVSLIVVHELGHFIAAKLFRIRVEEFGIGYPPRAFLLGKIRETEYTLNWIPFGGFVRLFGEDDQRAHGRGSLIDAPRWKQAIILVAGVTMNAIAAFMLFVGAYSVGILHPVEEPGPGVRLVVSDIVAGSPAHVAGVQLGDELVALEDASGTEAELTPSGVMAFVSERAGEELSLTYAQAGTTTTATVRPAHAVVAEEAGRPAIGIGLVLVTTEALPLSEAFVEGYYHTIGMFKVVGVGIGTLLKDAVMGKPDLRDIAGPVGIVSAVGEAADNGWGYVLSLAGFISVNLAIINLVPIPALDGGRLLVIAVEGAMRRSAPKIAVQLLNTVGLALIILLMVTVTYNDIARLLA